ncbi:MAG TPA: dTMP kinase [bacterium]|nr:dTMP kinase [bacterium]
MAEFFITVEGIEGSGKTTIAERLEAWLRSRGHTTFLAREPGGTAVGEALRKLILDARHPLCVESELLLIEAARAQLMDEVVLPRLDQGQTVILDRHIDSTTAYQGYGRGLDLDWIARLNHFATRGRRPDRTLLLDVDAAVGLSRARGRNLDVPYADRFETEERAFMERVRQGFLTLARQDPARVHAVDAARDVDAVWGEVREDIQNTLPN